MKTKYVDGFVLTIPKEKVDEYRKMAEEAKEVWMRHGALAYRECMLDDPEPENITFFFPLMAKAKPDETVWFSYIEYESKAERDRINAMVMKEFDEKYKDTPDKMQNMPFDMERMAYGGFEVIV